MKRALPLCLLVLLPLAGCTPPEPPKVGVQEGNMAPQLEATDIDGKRHRLTDYRGKVVVLDFWATWCGPCVSMIPHEKALVNRMQGRPLVFIGISEDKTEDKLRSFMDSNGVTWPNIFDGYSGPLSASWKVDGFPTMFIIDAEGIIRKRVEGADFNIDFAIEKLVNQAEGK